LASLAKERLAQTAARHQIKNLSDGSVQTLETLWSPRVLKNRKTSRKLFAEAKAALGNTPRATFQASIYASGLHREFNPDSVVPADAMSEKQTFRSETKSQPEADPPLAEMGLCL
jgi:hypothetical protein